MGNGLSDYWRARRQYEKEQKVMNNFLHFMQKLLNTGSANGTRTRFN